MVSLEKFNLELAVSVVMVMGVYYDYLINKFSVQEMSPAQTYPSHGFFFAWRIHLEMHNPCSKQCLTHTA